MRPAYHRSGVGFVCDPRKASGVKLERGSQISLTHHHAAQAIRYRVITPVLTAQTIFPSNQRELIVTWSLICEQGLPTATSNVPANRVTAVTSSCDYAHSSFGY